MNQRNFTIKLASVIALVLLCISLRPVHAQQNASLVGVVQDELSGLPGVNVRVKDQNSKGAITDLAGKFRLTNLPTGKSTLVLSFIGYENHEVEVDLTAGETKDLGEVNMKVLVTELDDVVVKGTYFPSQQRALNIKKQSPGIMEVMAADAIGKLPDRNAAEAVQRIQGVSIERDQGEGRYALVRGTPAEWNSTLINGDRLPASDGTSDNSMGTRSVPLDIFPSDMIEYVQLSKAITPDMEGDAIGGSINFITRTAPQNKTFNVSLGGGYNGQAEKPMYSASMLYGDRIGKFGFMVSAAYWNRNWGSDNYEVEYNFSSPDPKEQFAVDNLQLRDYMGQRTTLGLNVGLEYEFNTNHRIFARGVYSDFTDNEIARQHNFYFLENMAEVMTRNGKFTIQLSGGEVGGEHNLGNGWSLDWKASTYLNDMSTDDPKSLPKDERGYPMAFFQQRGVVFDDLVDGYKYLQVDDPSGDPEDDIQPDMQGSLDPQQLVLSQLLSYGIGSREQDVSGQLDIGKKINEKLTLTAGGKYKHKTREGGTPLTIWIPGAFLGIPNSPAPATLADLQTESFPENGGFLQEIGSPYEDILIDQITTKQLRELYTDDVLNQYGMYKISRGEDSPDAATGFYTGKESVVAAYIMGEYSISDQLMLIGGVRNESTTVDYKGKQVTTTLDANGDEVSIIQDVENHKTTNALLPMLHIKYSPQENLNIRAAYTRTFARPNFSDLNPGEVRNDQTRTITKGNVDLNPTYSNNLDLMAEYFFQDVGLLSGGVFYKQITDVIFKDQSILNISGQNYQVIEPKNLESAWLAGFEVGISKRMSFLPGALNGFGVEANYTYTRSELEVPRYEEQGGQVVTLMDKQSLPRQPKNIFNASVYYEKYGLMVRVAANFKGKYIDIIRQEAGPENYRWYDKNLTVDLSAAYSITKSLRFFLELNNLTNAPLRYYHGVSERPEQVEYYSVRGQAGLRFNLF
ncbi:hypothetical protein BFP72_07725 [Reichenbachiella sp. 5M10]|uniref:TonB-dependent receptor n=1 Tax=Reichenbachiella sp. 5M10 TaxID=1889772 RepID=UPI000C147633|nr:TonB-dependent receptor [Reichenbachiella sp. 5M10]PIB35294.1 hypothetical protein BFP72_07725 [Reichenbachiella sp. 5M10]